MASNLQATAPSHSGASTQHGAAVTLSALQKRYGPGKPAVQEVSLDVAPGEFVTLLGPSGSGKTTTLMMVAGFESVTSGDIFIDGRSVRDLPPHKRDIGMVFQNYALFPHMTVRDNIAFPLKMRRWSRTQMREAVDRSLDLVRLGEFGDRYPAQMSGGQQQRVALARATVFSPKLLLMDEPLGALDRQLRQTMQFEIKNIQRSLGLTVVSVTHDQEEALTMSDRIVVMDQGRLVQVGSPADIYERPAAEFVAEFVGETNLLRGKVTHADPDGSEITLDAGVKLRTHVVLPVGNRVTVSVRPERIHITSQADQPRGNTFKVQVENSAYSGATKRCVVRLSDTSLVVRTDNSVHIGESTQLVNISPHDVTVVETAPDSRNGNQS